MDPLDALFSNPDADPYGFEARLLRRTLDRLVAAELMPQDEADAILRWYRENRERRVEEYPVAVDPTTETVQ